MNVKVLKLTNGDIPEGIRNIPDAPKELFVSGNDLKLLTSSPLVAIVGSRKVDSYGIHVTRLLAGDLARAGVGIVSGLALGVDAIAHQSALQEKGTTIAVLPCGIDTVYPSSNTPLAERILQQGALVSEHPGSYTPHKHDFLIRNRLISGLSKGVIVTQAAARSGSLNTARHALEQGRVVMAVPGPITNPLCEGPNNLLKMGAIPVTCAGDVLSALNIEVADHETDHELMAESQLELDIIRKLKTGVVDAELIAYELALSIPAINSTLTILEIRGVICPLGGNRWSLK